jgi:hypothetical protein
MKRLFAAALVLAVVAMASLAQAQSTEKTTVKKEVSPPAANPTGTWTWSLTIGDQKRDMTLKLKLDGEKLTGALVNADATETAITEGKFAKDEVSFTVVRERNGTKMTSKYTGKVSGDSIKGKSEFGPEGSTQSRDWEATRAKDAPKKPAGDEKKDATKDAAKDAKKDDKKAP